MLLMKAIIAMMMMITTARHMMIVIVMVMVMLVMIVIRPNCDSKPRLLNDKALANVDRFTYLGSLTFKYGGLFYWHQE